MYKNFLKPFLTLVGVYVVGLIGVTADIDQLFNFNIVEFIKKNTPISYIFIIVISVLLYAILVIIQLTKNNKLKQKLKSDCNSGQIFKAHNIQYLSNSCIKSRGTRYLV